MEQPPSRFALEFHVRGQSQHLRELNLFDRDIQVLRQIALQSGIYRRGREQHFAHADKGELPLEVVKAALNLQENPVLRIVGAALGELLQLLESDIDAPREIQLTAKVDREQHLLAIRVEHRDTTVVRLQQGRDIALRGFLDVDDRERDPKARKALHASLDHLVL